MTTAYNRVNDLNVAIRANGIRNVEVRRPVVKGRGYRLMVRYGRSIVSERLSRPRTLALRGIEETGGRDNYFYSRARGSVRYLGSRVSDLKVSEVVKFAAEMERSAQVYRRYVRALKSREMRLKLSMAADAVAGRYDAVVTAAREAARCARTAGDIIDSVL